MQILQYILIELNLSPLRAYKSLYCCKDRSKTEIESDSKEEIEVNR